VIATTFEAELGGDRSALIDANALARLLDRSLSSIWRDNAAGNIPQPVSIGGAKKWRRSEILAWIDAGCPKRKAWEALSRPIRQKAG
jgi:predicted DNA-binding transcriptional regulator AlpA